MSGTPPTLGLYSRARDFLIRNQLSHGLTWIYSRFGFTNRNNLSQQLNNLSTRVDNHGLFLDRLVEQGILKSSFRRQVTSLDEVQAFMLHGTNNLGRIRTVTDQPNYFDENQLIVNRLLGTVIPRGYYALCQYYESNELLAAVFSSGIKHATSVAKTLGIPLGIMGGAWFLGGLPTVTPGLIIAGVTATCVLATKINTILPNHGFWGEVGSATRWFSRKLSLPIYAVGGGYLGLLAFQANLNIMNIFNSLGLEGTAVFLTGLALALNTFVRSKINAFDKAFGGMLDPGVKKVMKSLLSTAAYSSTSEVHYLGTRMMLFGGATLYIAANTFAALGAIGFLPLSLPILGIAATVALRSKNTTVFTSKEQADQYDRRRIKMPFYGLAAGAGAALVVGGVAAVATGLASLTFFAPIVYTTFFGSLTTLFVNELHGTYHSLNTNNGWMGSLLTSARDLMGEMEMKALLKKHSRVLAINPHTNLHEHTLGLLFSALLNRRPGVSFICMYDLILAQAGGNNLKNHRMEKEFVTYVKGLQGQICTCLRTGIQQRSDVATNYRQLASNLRSLADWFDSKLRQELDSRSSAGMPTFFNYAEVAEVRRAIFEQLAVRAEEFRKIATRLETQATRGQVSEQDFYSQWSELLHCYDPQLVKIQVVARKNLSGDERKVRKVENVATGLILRGVTAYKGWGKEVSTDRHPPEDWIGGTWTQVPNPEFSYYAAPGSQKGAKYLWVKVETVLTDLQTRNREFLSSSKEVAAVENKPTAAQGFQAGATQVELEINGRVVPVTEYFYADTTKIDQEAVPRVDSLVYRAGVTALRSGYEIAYYNHTENPEMMPYVIAPPAFDYSVMMDKNDVQVKTTSMPAFLKRAARDTFIHLVRRFPVDRLFHKEVYRFANPFPERTVDVSQGLRVFDANLELSMLDDQGRERGFVPYKVDRSAAQVGINESAVWQSLHSAKVIRLGGKTTGFHLIYEKFSIPNKQVDNKTDSNIASVVRQANGGKIVVTYQGGTVHEFAAPAGVTPNTAEQILEYELTPDGKNIWIREQLEMPMPPRDFPEFLDVLPLPEKGEVSLSVNNFTQAPHREGDVSWVKISYQPDLAHPQGSVGFARTADGKRPMLNNKDLHVRATPSYYDIHISPDGSTITVDNVRVQRGCSLFVPRGWARDMEEGVKLTEGSVNTSGDIFITADDRITPIRPNAKAPNYKGQMIGLAYKFDAVGKVVKGYPKAVLLGNYIVRHRAEHLQAAIEITPAVDQHGHLKPGKFSVVTRRLDTKGLTEDSSKYVYTLTGHAAKQVADTILDLSWIDDVRVTKESVLVTYATPESSVPKTLELPSAAFRDNDGFSLLKNGKARMTSEEDLYQSHDAAGQPTYVDETERFKPQIDIFNGNIRLAVHKVDRAEVALPTGLTIDEGAQVKIFPAAADAMVQLEDGRWVPLATPEPLTHLDQIDYHFSQVNEGQIKQVIGPQTRFGENNNISSEYVRDPYFYGLTITALFSTIEKYGENFAINRAKAIRAFRGIQSGRTHCMPWQLLYNEMADVLETNNHYFRKLSNFAEEIWGPGVSEDTQLEMAYWLKGIRMWVVKEMVALMAAEKKWGNYNVQNTTRYNYSEVLFNLSFMLSRIDAIEGRMLGRQPVMMSWGEMSEIGAGKTWYKQALAKAVELTAIPLYLASGGHILWYPVDLVYFLGAWTARTVFSSLNYTKHLVSLGYGFLTGFWKNPGIELTFLRGYFIGAISQFIKRYQYGTFAATVGGTDDSILKANRKVIRWSLATTGVSVGIASLGVIFGGLAPWLLIPFGLAAIPTGLRFLAKGLGENKGLKKFALAAGGVAAVGVGAAMIVAGLPALTNLLSIALIANLAFGLYQAGIASRGLSDIRRTLQKDAPQRTLSAPQNGAFQAVITDLAANKLTLSYRQLNAHRENLRTILREIGIMDSKLKVTQGAQHPYRNEAFHLLDVYAEIEMAMCIKAVRDLNLDPNNAVAKSVLLNLLTESKEYLVIDYAAKAYRQFQFKLPFSLGDFLFGRAVRVMTT